MTLPVDDTPTQDPALRAGRLPELVIAGVTKAGTTSLYRYLSQHPDVCPADEKELRHFLPLRYGEPVAPLEEYAAHFRHETGQAYAVEASPGYFYGGRAVAQAIEDALDQPRVVVLLREPGARCWSFYNFMRSRARLPQDSDFDDYLDVCEQRHREGVDLEREHHDHSGLGTGCYDTWLGDWIDVFGDRLRVLFFDDLARDPAGTVADLCRWLGIDPGPAAGIEYRVENKTQQFKRKGLQKRALAWNRKHVLFFERHQGVKRALRRVYFLVNRAQDSSRPSAAARARLDRFFAPHNARVAEQLAPLGLALPPWLDGSRGR